MEPLPLLLRLCLWTGIVTLYFGFAGVMGVLLRRVRPPRRHRYARPLAVAHALFLFVPASALIVGLADWPSWVRLGFFLAGLGLVGLAAEQPDWFPKRIWRRTFGHQYFAGTMGLAALWGVGVALSAQALAPILVGAAATVAGLASLYTIPRVS